MIHVWGGSARESWGAIPEYHNAVPVQSAHPMSHFHGMVRPGRQTILSTDRSYRMIEHVRKGGDPSELPDEPGPLADIHSKCPMLEQLAHDMHVASGKASYEEACGIVAAAGLKMKRCMAAFFLLEKICGRNTSREEKVETLKARFGKNQAALDTLIKKHNRDFASKGGDASFAKACDFFALAGLDGSEAVAPWLLVLKICGKGCSTREEQLAELKEQYGGRQATLDTLIKKHNRDVASKGGDASFKVTRGIFKAAGLPLKGNPIAAKKVLCNAARKNGASIAARAQALEQQFRDKPQSANATVDATNRANGRKGGLKSTANDNRAAAAAADFQSLCCTIDGQKKSFKDLPSLHASVTEYLKQREEPGPKEYRRLAKAMADAKHTARKTTSRKGRVWAGVDRAVDPGASIWTLSGSPLLIEFTLKH